jgi:hypothetical protein
MTTFNARRASTSLRIAALLGFYATATLIGGCLFAMLLRSGAFVAIDVLFYRGLAALVVSGLLLLGTLWALLRPLPERLGLTARDTWGAAIVALSLLLVVFVLGPVTFDRSISIFLLSQFELAGAPLSEQSARDIFLHTYIDDWDQIGRRLREQEISGNLVRTPQGFMLTAQGRLLMETARVFSRIFGGDPRIVGAHVAPPERDVPLGDKNAGR